VYLPASVPHALDAWRARGVPDHGIAIKAAAMQRYEATDGGPLF